MKKFNFLFILAGFLAVTSCETKFSLNGDYELKPIIFGLLDHTDTIHYVKITKAFLGDGDNLQYAQIADSSYFEQVDAKVIEYINDAPTGREWQLKDSTVYTKDENGVFYAPAQKIYYFLADDLDSTAEYELIADLNEGSMQIDARTTMISNFKVSGQLYLPTYKINFASYQVDDDEDYTAWVFSVTEGLNASKYNYKYTFRWREWYTDGSYQDFSATRNDGDVYQTNKPSNPLVQTAYFSGLEFYQWVAQTVPDNDDVDRRNFLGIDLQIAVAHENLNQYMEVAQPVTGIAQVQPEYTNINNGLGLFSSRIIFKLTGFPLDASSTRELCEGFYTVSKKFCSQLPEHASEPFFCP